MLETPAIRVRGRLSSVAVHHLGHGRTLALGVGVRLQGLFVERAQIDQVGGEAEVFLGDLELHAEVGLRHGPEQRMERLARLEVDRPVLDLDDDVVAELAVERLELAVALLGAVVGLLVRIDEGPPHHDPAVRPHRVGQHVGPVDMGAAVVLRSRLALRIGLHQEAAEIGNGLVDLVGFGLPEGADGRVQRVGGLQAADLDRGREPGRQIDLDAVRPEHVGQGRGLGDIRRGQAVGLGVDVVQHRAVDADRRVGPGVVDVAGVLVVGQLPPVPQRGAGIAALHMAIQVVPVVQQAVIDLGGRQDIQLVDALPRLDQAQIVEDAVQHADVAVGGDHRGLADGSNEVALLARALQRQVQGRDGGRAGGGAQQNRRAVRDRRAADQAVQPALQLGARDFQCRGVGAGRDGPDRRTLGRRQRPIAQPQVIAVFGMGRGCAQRRRDQAGRQAEPTD
jgi:hypothetical protein